MEEALGWEQRAVIGRPFRQTGFSAYENLANGYEKMNRQTGGDSLHRLMQFLPRSFQHLRNFSPNGYEKNRLFHFSCFLI
ncbi:MAG: hypothetical protein KDD10_18175 [Phaeodactylibacter sp.]|nr:hypothetical protein [Phaeodactylibacter sp.]MCB9295328.1 hypothetical protein [Lewinellaceae bacterium]